MSVRIQLDNPHTFFTNLDFISGRVILHLVKDETVAAIHVKLEGEAKTVLMRPPPGPQYPQGLYPRNSSRQGIAAENHKILYVVERAFPDASAGNSYASGLAYTLRAGQHEYPFRIKIPFNNVCSDPGQIQIGPGGQYGGLGLNGLNQLQYQHVRKTLPPSLTGFPGEAEIRYYIKVTVQRPSIFKENRRSAIGFKFMPIEPPRPEPSANETFARRPYAFQDGGTAYAKKSMFKKKATQLSETAPRGEVDARLPSPPLLTCNKPVPLRLLLKKTHPSAEHVFLTSFQMQLIGYTEVRAQDVVRTEMSSWTLISMMGLAQPIGKPDDPVGTQTVLDGSLWDQIPLPNTVAPSFVTCNLSRRYEMEIRVGLGYGYPGEIQPQHLSLPLKFQVTIYSGIAPPSELLNAMAAQAVRPAIPARPKPQVADPLYPPQLGTQGAATMEEAPPSYEDAMAGDFTPATGPRPAFSGVTDENAPSMDEKGKPPPPGHEKGGPPAYQGGAGPSSAA